MGRPKGTKNKKTIMQEYEENPKLDIAIDKIFDEVLNTPIDKLDKEIAKSMELKNTALSVIDNEDGTKTVLKIPFDYKTLTFGTPEIIESSDNTNALFRFRVVAGDTFG